MEREEKGEKEPLIPAGRGIRKAGEGGEKSGPMQA